ncbi:MAG: SDR family oxidoreductase [Proteobacteria bacterium]|nr:SDR family oxidoreductase [Pseudomonadota bacterium]
MDVSGKIIVVTGAASGIGRALCRRFAREGARTVVGADIDETGARATTDEINGLAVRCDISREADVAALIERTEKEVGPIDLYFSNAGISVAGGVEVSNEDWERIWQINVMSHIYAARVLVPAMIARGGGWFAITASAAGLLSQIGSTPYSVTKHAAVGLAENLAITYGDQGLGVSVLCPQAVRSAMTMNGGGVAAVDGLMEPEVLCDAVMDGLTNDRFMILPHVEVQTYIERKAGNYDRWIQGMRRLQQRFRSAAPLKD